MKNLTPLMLAAEAGQKDEVRNLLERGEDINSETEGGCTALDKAVSGHHPETIHLLAQHGAVMSASSLGFTALHLAAILNDVPCAKALLDCGADMNVQTMEYGQTPILEAMNEGDGDFMGPEVARLLIERGADLTLKDIEGKTVLDYALNYYNNWSRFPDSEWFGESPRSLIKLVRQTVADHSNNEPN